MSETREQQAYQRGVKAARPWGHIKRRDQRCMTNVRRHKLPCWVGHIPMGILTITILTALVFGGIVIASSAMLVGALLLFCYMGHCLQRRMKQIVLRTINPLMPLKRKRIISLIAQYMANLMAPIPHQAKKLTVIFYDGQPTLSPWVFARLAFYNILTNQVARSPPSTTRFIIRSSYFSAPPPTTMETRTNDSLRVIRTIKEIEQG